jgi:molybdate transport system substrate-binding protein
MSRRGFSRLVTLVLLLAFCGVVQAQSRTEVLVSAAISMKNAFEEIGRVYEATNRDVKVSFNFGASGDLARQIEGGAPVDVFVSAAITDMDTIDSKGLILGETRVNFARNKLALVVPAQSVLRIASFVDLQKLEVKKIALGSPKTVPAGRYAEEVLRHYGVLGSLRERLVFAENVRQVLDYVARGEVDAGMVYSTDAMTRPKEVSVVATAPEGSHKPILYPIAVIKGTKWESAARGLVSLVVSPEGRKILERHGFEPIQGK